MTTAKARQKVDSTIRDMFDAEVEKPDHDRILTNLFQDDAALISLLTAYHQAEPLPPITSASTFRMDTDSQYGQTLPAKNLSLADAIAKTGITPRWASVSPIRINHKSMESPLYWSSDPQGRYTRVMGFIDILVHYTKVGWPTIRQATDGTCTWVNQGDNHRAFIEVKGTWPTVGNLVRQLNLYRVCSRNGNDEAAFIVVGPDDTMNSLLCDHKYRLATFDATGTSFQLIPSAIKASFTDTETGVF